MLCRALLAIVAVSYLICVMILGGLQKEDLDVNMLKKLQRHGLDIDAMNNESLRDECLKNVKTTKKAESTTNDKEEVISTTKIAETTKEQSKFSSDFTNKPILQKILKQIFDLQSRDKKKQNIQEKPKSLIIENYNIPQSSNLKYIFSDTLGYNSPELKKNDVQIITTEGGMQLFPQNILNLWNTYNKQDIKDITSLKPTTTAKTTSDPAKEILYVKKLLEDFISKHDISSTTTVLPTTKQSNVDQISDILRRFVTKTNVTNQMLENNVSKNDNLTENITEKHLINEDLDEIRNYLIDNELIGKNGTAPSDHKNIYEPHTETTKSFNDDNINIINNLYANMQKKKNSDNKKSLPPDLIKELAESVKELVLKDLKKEISTIIPVATITTTEIPMTITPKYEEKKTSEASVVMDKIMELFQQIKSIKEKTIITGNSTIIVTEKTDIHHQIKGPARIMYSYKPAISPYLRPPVEQFAPIYLKHYNHEANVNIPSYNEPNIQNAVYQVHQIDNYNAKDGLRLAPITIQTNGFEVPPLNIPIFKPLGMINQNIIVTTESPNRRPQLDTHHTNFIHHIDRYNLQEDFRTRNDWHKPTANPKRYSHSRFDYDIPKVNNHYGSKRDHYKPHFTKSDYERMRLRNQEIKRFHERLEKIDEPRSLEDKEDCCKLKVASRQQLPLNEAKKRSRYDDIHFRNFLKTQQKVNDMLEKILSNKAKSDGPISVETT